MIMKKVILLPISLLMLLMFITWGCEDEATDDTEDDAVCVAGAADECPALSFNACSDSNGDYYEYNDTKYYCDDYSEQDEVDENGDAIECSGAAASIVTASGCATSTASVGSVSLKSAKASYVSFLLEAMDQVRAEAKAAAGCY